MTNCKLSARGLGLSLGIIWGISVLATGLLAYSLNYGLSFVVNMKSLYIGYEASIMGSIIGGVYGFIDGLIGGAILAWLYNIFASDCGCCNRKDTIP